MSVPDEYEKRGFSKRFGFALGIGIVLVVVIVLLIGQKSKANLGAPAKPQEVYIVRPLPPPPPPPPPPRVQEPPKEIPEKMLEQTPVANDEPKPDNQPKEAPSEPLSTSMSGPGSDGFGLAAGNGGGGGGSGGNGGGRGGSRFGYYAAVLQKAFQDALNQNAVTQQAQFVQKARIWADGTGRVTRVKLAGSTGDAALDKAIEEALTGLQLSETPPRDMPMPVVMKLSAHRPG